MHDGTRSFLKLRRQHYQLEPEYTEARLNGRAPPPQWQHNTSAHTLSRTFDFPFSEGFLGFLASTDGTSGADTLASASTDRSCFDTQ